MGCSSSAETKGRDIQALSVDEQFFALHVDKGHMNEARRQWVQRIYATMGDETSLTAEKMGAAFDADAHPDVVAGNRKAIDVRNELIETLGASGGPVTLQLFEDYYDIQSITLEDDDKFKALVRSSWIHFIREQKKAAKRAASREAPNHSQ